MGINITLNAVTELVSTLALNPTLRICSNHMLTLFDGKQNLHTMYINIGACILHISSLAQDLTIIKNFHRKF